ncbi:hypothetical protein M011DRAFT_474877 [Sporormia fimetaria CBS 119925]|uniref:Uncharacterized protein n=1 Tax=Sporormia fimetaria CBS 119925 TaxID=1340428 RepID=A0A6A6VKW5_9PLEO|nr:hypothetical protein M011DRAFT_474877 [Sporormia fimetaria CBS 119925]
MPPITRRMSRAMSSTPSRPGSEQPEHVEQPASEPSVPTAETKLPPLDITETSGGDGVRDVEIRDVETLGADRTHQTAYRAVQFLTVHLRMEEMEVKKSTERNLRRDSRDDAALTDVLERALELQSEDEVGAGGDGEREPEGLYRRNSMFGEDDAGESGDEEEEEEEEAKGAEEKNNSEDEKADEVEEQKEAGTEEESEEADEGDSSNEKDVSAADTGEEEQETPDEDRVEWADDLYAPKAPTDASDNPDDSTKEVVPQGTNGDVAIQSESFDKRLIQRRQFYPQADESDEIKTFPYMCFSSRFLDKHEKLADGKTTVTVILRDEFGAPVICDNVMYVPRSGFMPGCNKCGGHVWAKLRTKRMCQFRTD